MASRRTLKLRNTARLSAKSGSTDLPTSSPERPEQADVSFQNPALGDDLYGNAASSPEIGPEREGKVTPVKTTTDFDENNLEQLRNKSKTTVGQFDSSTARSVGSYAPESPPEQYNNSLTSHSSESLNRKTSPSLRLISELTTKRDEEAQEQRIGYLQANGLGLASTRRSASAELLADSRESISTGSNKAARALDAIAPTQGVDRASVFRVPNSIAQLGDSESETWRALHMTKARKLEGRSTEDETTTSVPLPAPEPSCSFQIQRAREATNWFSGSRTSKTLLHQSKCPERLSEPSTSRNDSLRGQSSRSASLRRRNNRLPPAYALPTEQPLLVACSAVTSDHEGADERSPNGNLKLFPSLRLSPGKELAAALIAKSEADDNSLISAPLNVPRRAPPDLTIDTAMSGALAGAGEISLREICLNEVMDGVYDGEKPVVPPKSPDRPSARNSAFLSIRGSMISSVPEPPPSELAAPAAKAKKSNRLAWVKFGVFGVSWVIATSLTLFGVSRSFPLDRDFTMCTLEQAQTCKPPSFSFKHDIRLNMTLPSALSPFLPSLHLNTTDNLLLTDRGIEVFSKDATSPVELRGGLILRTSFTDNGAGLLSDIIYTGVIHGDQADEKAARKLGQAMEQASPGSSEKMAHIISAQGTSRNVSAREDGASTGMMFFALWLGSILAVELILFSYFAVLPLLCAGATLTCNHWLREDGIAAKRVGGRKREIITASRLAFMWVLAVALGTAGAGGLLVAFWAQRASLRTPKKC